MAVNVTNLLAGPGVLYTGAFGAVEPATVKTAPAVAWTDVGATQGGVTLTIKRDLFELEVDQIVDVPGRRLTKRDVNIKTNLAEATLENFALSVSEPAANVVVSGTGVTAAALFEPTNDISAFVPGYNALLFDGTAPGVGKARRVIARKVLSIDSVEASYVKDGQVLFPVTWATHFISASVKPYAIQDDRSTP